MKNLRYLVCLVACLLFSCGEEPVVKRTGDDDPIIIPPPKPGINATTPLDSLDTP